MDKRVFMARITHDIESASNRLIEEAIAHDASLGDVVKANQGN